MDEFVKDNILGVGLMLSGYGSNSPSNLQSLLMSLRLALFLLKYTSKTYWKSPSCFRRKFLYFCYIFFLNSYCKWSVWTLQYWFWRLFLLFYKTTKDYTQGSWIEWSFWVNCSGCLQSVNCQVYRHKLRFPFRWVRLYWTFSFCKGSCDISWSQFQKLYWSLD